MSRLFRASLQDPACLASERPILPRRKIAKKHKLKTGRPAKGIMIPSMARFPKRLLKPTTATPLRRRAPGRCGDSLTAVRQVNFRPLAFHYFPKVADIAGFLFLCALTHSVLNRTAPLRQPIYAVNENVCFLLFLPPAAGCTKNKTTEVPPR